MQKCSIRISPERVCEILSKNYFFLQMGQEALVELVSSLWQYELEPGEILIEEGKADANMYLVIGGRVEITKIIGDKSIVINEIGAGETIGLHALVAGIKNTVTATALRKTKILVITRDIFNAHISKYPSSLMEIAGISTRQALTQFDLSFKSKSAYNVVFIPAGNYQHLLHFVDLMRAEISINDSCLFVDENFILNNSLLNISSISDEKIDEIIHQLELLEDRYSYLFFIASAEFNDWTRICIRMAHRVVAVAEETDDFSLNQTESAIFSEWAKIHATKELVLIHNSQKKYATHDAEWIAYRGLETIFNIREGNRNDMARFIRNVTNRSIALVLSGGGARGFCHLGLMRALEELQISVDYVAGTSIGAVFSAFLAMEISYQELYDDVKTSLKNYSSLVDYTIPIHSLAGGKRLDEILQQWLTSHVMIENLWRPSFYVATDLSSGELAVLNKGCLWRAVRASASLPGVFPPVADENGRILVDGAILNNLPVDIMSKYLHDSSHGRGRIIAVSIETIDNSFKYRGTYHQAKQGMLSKLSEKIGFNKEGEKLELPSIFLTISKSMMLASEHHMQEMLKYATHNVIINPKGYDLLDFKNVLKAVDIGYTSALAQLKKIAKEL